MSLTASSFVVPRGAVAPDFTLPDTISGTAVNLHSLRGDGCCVVMFICNHCPYVLHVLDTLLRRAYEYQARDVVFIAISSNDAKRYPQDGPDAMGALAKARGFGFPYLFDQTQAVARAYGAACTPDFFVVGRDGRLAWSGRFDDSTPGNGRPVTGDDLAAALDAVIDGRPCDDQPKPSMGCNIKWI